MSFPNVITLLFCGPLYVVCLALRLALLMALLLFFIQHGKLHYLLNFLLYGEQAFLPLFGAFGTLEIGSRFTLIIDIHLLISGLFVNL